MLTIIKYYYLSAFYDWRIDGHMTYNNTHIYSKIRMRGQYYFQYGMIGAYYLSSRHFTYYDVNLKYNIYVVYDD